MLIGGVVATPFPEEAQMFETIRSEASQSLWERESFSRLSRLLWLQSQSIVLGACEKTAR